MSERDGFSSGFFIGTLVGGIIGGAIGAIAASRQKEANSDLNSDPTSRLESDENMESTRRSLEDKINQLNLAIDDVREQLGGVKGREKEESS
ncbi:MAG: hypothetical protein RI580_15580 [Halothece sp. Uz-M2-17]|nr:hypothetical protein [Halothece sp. Uz-M2-17]